MSRLIDVDALTEDCKRYLGTLNPDKDGKECTRIHWLVGVLENAPTIEPERKKGKWNWVGFNIECPECGFMPIFDSTEPLYKFCPNCGSPMDGGEQE